MSLMLCLEPCFESWWVAVLYEGIHFLFHRQQRVPCYGCTPRIWKPEKRLGAVILADTINDVYTLASAASIFSVKAVGFDPISALLLRHGSNSATMGSASVPYIIMEVLSFYRASLFSPSLCRTRSASIWTNYAPLVRGSTQFLCLCVRSWTPERSLLEKKERSDFELFLGNNGKSRWRKASKFPW